MNLVLATSWQSGYSTSVFVWACSRQAFRFGSCFLGGNQFGRASLFEQKRIGYKGEPFEILKFRSMYVTSPKYDRSPEDSRDPRITPAGRFLRKTSLDELPQLINVLLRQMSLGRPWPEMPYIVSEYTLHQKQRLAVPQGLTGMWQLSADRKYAIHDSIEYDLSYIENCQFSSIWRFCCTPLSSL